MYSSVLPLVGWLVTLLICAFAWFKGGPAERIGGLIVLVSGVVAMAIHAGAPEDLKPLLLLADEAFMAGGFLFLALRYMSLWLGGAMLLQAIQFSLHAYYLVIELPHDRRYALVNNLDSLGVLICILVGTILAWRRRGRAAK